MKTKNLFRVLPAVAAVLLFAACSGDDQNVAPVTEPETPAGKGTVIHYSATVSDGTTTRATLNSSNEYVFQTGDQLLITGTNISGTLTLQDGDAGKTSGATFEGDLKYTGEGTPADNLELQAVLVSNNNAMTTLTYASAEYPTTAIASTLAEAVEKYSHFKATSTYGDKSFSMDQQTSFLNFTVTLTDGTTAGTDLDITIKNGGSTVCTGTVTTVDDSGIKAKFVAAMPAGTTMSSATFQLGSKSAVSFGGTTTLEANKIYNISKTISIPGLLTGKFTVDSDGTQVYFSKGNLRATYDGSSWTWAFAENQWDYIGNAAGNTSISGDGTVSASNVTVDLFGWVGASNTTWSGDLGTTGNAAMHGISNSTATNNTNGYGNNASEALKSDWGNTIGSGWRTLTSDEWTYLFNTRTVKGNKGSGYSYTLGQSVEGKLGVVIYPDDYTGSEYAGSDWSTFEAAGCVFLPAAGDRNGTSVYDVGSYGYYWSSTAYDTDGAYNVYFDSGYVDPANDYNRGNGFSVRLVRQVE